MRFAHCIRGTVLSGVPLILCAAAAAQQPSDETIKVLVTACDPLAEVHFKGTPAEGRPGEYEIAAVALTGPALDIVVVPNPDLGGTPANENAIIYIPSDRCSFQLKSVAGDLRFVKGTELRLNVTADGQPAGDWIDVYREGDGRSLYIEFADAATPALSVVVKVLGSGRIARTANGIDVRVADGSFICMRDAQDTRLETLTAAGENAVTLTTAGFGAKRRDATIAAEMTSSRGALVQRSLLTEFASVAEETAEGSLEPPSRGSPVAVSATLLFARVTDIVPRGAGFSSLALASSTARSVAGAGIQSTAESFLASGNAALAVVGARLQNTRVVANPAQGGALSISGQLGRRFTLGGQ